MIPQSRETLGKLLVLIGLGSIVLFTGLTGLLAPPVTQTDATDNADRGRTLVGVQGKPAGRVVMVNASGGTVWSHHDAEGYHDVSMLANGSVLAATITGGHTDCGRYDTPCYRTGFQIIDPSISGTKTVYNWSYPVRTPVNSEVHDVERLPSGNYVVAGMEYERIFIVTPQGDITWQWNASQHYDAPANPTKTDWLHINDVDRIQKDTFLISVRNRNQLLFIERGQGVTEVVNKDKDSSVLYRQHNPQYLGNGSILVADSDNGRVVELKKQQGEWTPVWSVSSAGGIPFDWPRDADRLPNGNTLITDSRNDRVVEVTPNGSLVWSISVSGLPYEADRLPHSERGQSPPITALRGGDPATTETASATAHLPVFSLLYAGLVHVLPVPYWLSVWHVVVGVVGLLTTGLGLVLWKRPARSCVTAVDTTPRQWASRAWGAVADSSVPSWTALLFVIGVPILLLGPLQLGIGVPSGDTTPANAGAVQIEVTSVDDPYRTGHVTRATLAIESTQATLTDVEVVFKNSQGAVITTAEPNRSVIPANQTVRLTATTDPRGETHAGGTVATVEVRATNSANGATLVRRVPVNTTFGQRQILNPSLKYAANTTGVPVFWERHAWTNTDREQVDIMSVAHGARGATGTQIRVAFNRSRTTGPWTMGGVGQDIPINGTGLLVTVETAIHTPPSPTPDTYSALTFAQNQTRLWYVFTPSVDERTVYTQQRGDLTYRLVYVPVTAGKPTDTLLNPARHFRELGVQPPHTCQQTAVGTTCGHFVEMRATVAGHPPFDRDAVTATFYRITPVTYNQSG